MRSLILFIFCFLIFDTEAQTDSLSLKFPVHSNYFSSFDNTKIYYEVRGEGKPVLLVHGFISNSNSWKRTALYTDLLNSGYKIILLDMRGNGKSDKPHDTAAYENDAEAKDIMKLMKILKVKYYSAIGYSRGSIITARLLVLDKRVKNAVLGGMGLDFTNPEWPRRKMFYRALMGDSVPELKGAVDYVRSQGLDRLALAYLQKAQPSTSINLLKKVKQPVLVICGDKDSDNGSAAELAKVLLNSSVATTPGDHNHASATPEFSKVILDFLLKQNYQPK
jgi:pimeloyl-ACP methyl ester carboxylesterase